MARDREPLEAVARSRRVRERDSLLGLHQARHEALEAADRHRDLQQRLASGAEGGTGDGNDLGAYAAQRLALLALEHSGTQARESHRSAETISQAAHAHWQRDRVRLEAIETLLVRRAEARLHERRAREARELDDIALQAWVRRGEAAS